MIEVRKGRKEDSLGIWKLMRKLAIFENYIDDFKITPEIVEHNGFEKERPDFYSLVAVDKEEVVGILIYYYLPFTAQNRPAIFIKELYIEDDVRGERLGERLMMLLKDEAMRNDCSQIKWTVANWNEKAMKFYGQLGARENKLWLNYEWNIEENNNE